jgi:hypothetical protein
MEEDRSAKALAIAGAIEAMLGVLGTAIETLGCCIGTNV